MTNNEELPDPKTLTETKKLVSKTYMGKFGIHGVSAKKSKDSIRLFARSETDELKHLKSEIEALAMPFNVEIVYEEMAKIGPPVSEGEAKSWIQSQLKLDDAFVDLFSEGILQVGKTLTGDANDALATKSLRTVVMTQQAAEPIGAFTEVLQILAPISAIIYGVIANFVTRLIESKVGETEKLDRESWLDQVVAQYFEDHSDLQGLDRSIAEEALRKWIDSKLGVIERKFRETKDAKN